jgi:hypothetical protein
MTQVGTTDVYETTLSLDTTATHFYKFLKDTSNTGWESVPAACGAIFQTVLNRQLNVPGLATTLATVCYNECSNCSTVTLNNMNKNEINIYPNPTSDFIIIENANGSSSSIYDINGRELYSSINTNDKQNIDISNFAKGLYFVKINKPNEVKMLRIIIK